MSNPWVLDQAEMLIRLILAMALGGFIGFEREFNNHAAGFRTHILVCMGSALIMLLSVYGFSAFVGEANVRIDPARLATAVITGIGFLGAGTIQFTGKSITGLTTAASIWVVAAIGLAIGAGFYFAAIISTVLVILILWLFNKMEQRFLKAKKSRILTIRAADQKGLLHQVNETLSAKAIITEKLSLIESSWKAEGESGFYLEMQFHLLIPKLMDTAEFIMDMKSIDGVFGVVIE